VREETGLNVEIVTGPVFRHPAVIGHAPQFTIMEMTAADPVNGPHRTSTSCTSAAPLTQMACSLVRAR
jgi:hypothetical protein